MNPRAFRARKCAIPAACLALSIALVSCSSATGGPEDDSNYPSDTLEMTVAFGPGGGVDIMSRTIADLLTENDLYPGDITVTNREGGSGSTGYGYVFNQEGSGYDMTATSGSFISTPLQGQTAWDTLGFTPIALLGTDETVIWVPADSPWQTLDDLIADAQTNPPVVGGAGATTIDYIGFAQIAEEAGFEFNYVAHDSGAEAGNSLLSGSVDVVSHSASALYGLYEAGDIRPLAIGGSERLSQLPDTPTFEELGFASPVSQPRGLMMPPGVSDEVIAFWEDALTQLVELPEWQDYLAQNFISERVLFGDEYQTYLEETIAAYDNALG